MDMARILVKTGQFATEQVTVAVRYFESETRRGRRYSAEIEFGPDDHIILDDDSVITLEARMARLVPATVYSRLLARTTAA
jgi:hypothetical protein